MAKLADVLAMLIPNGGYVAYGEEYETIQFIDCEPISKKQFEDGFKQFDELKAEQDQKKAADKSALYTKLGITEDEAKLLLG